jgi:hypothetical protein
VQQWSVQQRLHGTAEVSVTSGVLYGAVVVQQWARHRHHPHHASYRTIILILKTRNFGHDFKTAEPLLHGQRLDGGVEGNTKSWLTAMSVFECGVLWLLL